MLLRRFFSFFFLLFSLFPIDLVLMRFECPLVCAERWGRRGSTGSCLVEEFQSEAVRWGSVWVKAQREALKWELKWFAELRNPPCLPTLFFRVTPSVAAHRCTVNLCFSYPKTNPWVKQTFFFLSKNMGKIVPRSHSRQIQDFIQILIWRSLFSSCFIQWEKQRFLLL